jgi:hypothetical protein
VTTSHTEIRKCRKKKILNKRVLQHKMLPGMYFGYNYKEDVYKIKVIETRKNVKKPIKIKYIYAPKVRQYL